MRVRGLFNYFASPGFLPPGKAVTEHLAALGYRQEDLDAVIMTHMDIEHAGRAAPVKDPGAGDFRTGQDSGLVPKGCRGGPPCAHCNESAVLPVSPGGRGGESGIQRGILREDRSWHCPLPLRGRIREKDEGMSLTPG